MLLPGSGRRAALWGALALLLACLLAPVTASTGAPGAPGRRVEEPPALTRSPLPARSSSYLCTGYDACKEAGYPHAGYKGAGGQMYWRMYAGHNCTNYVAYRMVRAGMSPERPWSGSGMAYHWGVAMADITDDTPRVGAVAWWKKGSAWAPSSGHVAYVEEVVSADEIIVSEDSWGGDFHWRRVVRGTSGWPTGFIHFIDREVVAEQPPTISGTVEVGSPLVASPGSWRPAANYRYSWLVGGKPVPGATGTTYTPAPEDRGRKVTVQVTARKKGYAPGTAAAAPATVRPGTILATGEPQVTGQAEVDEVLELAPAGFSPTPATTVVRWYADGERLAVKDPRLPLDQRLIGATLQAEVVARAKGYRKVVLRTDPVGPVRAGTIELASPFAVSGKTRHGHTLRVVDGAFQPSDARVSYTWLRDGEPVAGAAGTSYLLGPDDVGRRITLQVDLRRTAYRDRTEKVATGVVTTRPEVRVDARARGRRAVVVVRVAAPGVAAPSGAVSVTIGQRVVEARVVDGRVRIVVPKLNPGRRAVKVRYAGSDDGVVEARRAKAPLTIPR